MTGTSAPLVVDVVVLVVVFVCPPEYEFVVVDVYPPVIWVLLPLWFVCEFVSFVESPHTGALTHNINVNKNASNKLFLNKATSKVQSNNC